MSDRLFLDDQNKINFVFTFALFFAAFTFKGFFLFRCLALIVLASKTCEVLFVSTGLTGWWVVCKTNAFWVKVMSWNLDEQWTAPLCFLCHAKAFPPRAGLIVHCCGHWLSSPQKVPHLLHLANPIICAFILVSNEENCRREILYIETEIHINIRKIDKMAVSPHWRDMLNSTLTAPGRFQFKQHHHHCRKQHRNKISGGSISSKYQVQFFFFFQSFPSCRWELVVEFNRGCWKMFLWKMMKSYFMVKQKSASNQEK